MIKGALITPPIVLSYDLCVPLAPGYLKHKCIRIEFAARHHGEETRSTTGYQSHALLVFGNGLLRIAAIHVPEYDFGQLVACGFVKPFCVLEVGDLTILGARVEFHIRYNIEPGRHYICTFK